MKKYTHLFFSFAFILLLSGFNDAEIENFEAAIAFEIPDNINAILDQSCVMCHNAESSNTKAKMKLKFETMADMKVSKQISKLSKIAKELTKGDMPPPKFLAKYPEKALSEEDKNTLIEWASNYATELSK